MPLGQHNARSRLARLSCHSLFVASWTASLPTFGRYHKCRGVAVGRRPVSYLVNVHKVQTPVPDFCPIASHHVLKMNAAYLLQTRSRPNNTHTLIAHRYTDTTKALLSTKHARRRWRHRSGRCGGRPRTCWRRRGGGDVDAVVPARVVLSPHDGRYQ